jgi:hypothetical protein
MIGPEAVPDELHDETLWVQVLFSGIVLLAAVLPIFLEGV